MFQKFLLKFCYLKYSFIEHKYGFSIWKYALRVKKREEGESARENVLSIRLPHRKQQQQQQ